MENKVDLKRIIIYLAFSFGIAWAWSLYLALNGGLAHSPVVIPFTNYTLAFFVLALGVMTAPTLAHLLTRLVTREGWKSMYLRPKFKRGWRFWLAAWVLPAVLTIIGGAVFYLLFPQYFDPQMKLFAAQVAAASKTPLPYSIQTLALIQLIQGVLLSPILNGLFTFGEEFGWRAYLLPKLMPLGGRKAVLISGVIWGIWHWPIIAMGHNYGLDYPGAPWLGMLLMVVFTVTIGALISWATIKAGSVWPAVIGHAAINGIAALAALAMQGSPSTLLGPFPTGLVGGIAFTALAIILFALPRAFMPVEEAA